MTHPSPISVLPTHEVTNQPPPLGDVDLYATDTALREAVARHWAAAAGPQIQKLGRVMGRADTMELANAANRHKPELITFDRYGRRVDEVEFHPAYHTLMGIAVEHGIPSVAWTRQGQGGHVTHVALEYIFGQVEGGVCCPMTMTHAAVPVLRRHDALWAAWGDKILHGVYDPKLAPIAQKAGVTIGMAMTEKQGGSDVRSNATTATPTAILGGGWHTLTGHKWFCSAPMSDAFLTLAQTEKGLTCFFVPRILDDGTRNPFFIQRLKDKLGNWSNASSEIEYNGTLGVMVGEPGRGIATILEMVHQTRLDTAMAPVGLMRQALIQAIHHSRHRTAFQRKLIDQPLMRGVLADLALEWEAAMLLLFRVAESYDDSHKSDDSAAFARLGVAIAKYHLNKLAPQFVYECMEALGGIGYVEESVLARLYREAPLNSIWEGSGNVICLDALRTAVKEPASLEALAAELAKAKGIDGHFDKEADEIMAMWRAPVPEHTARRLVERTAVLLQAALMIQFLPSAIAGLFCASRIAGDHGRAYGTLPDISVAQTLLDRVWPDR
jgi:putative acyl-CoA dehydrogenase